MRPALILDLAIVLVLLVGIYRGYRAGLLGGLIRLAGIVLGVFMAPLLVMEAEPYLPEALYARWPRLLLFVVAFVIVAGLVALVGKLVSRMVDWTPLGWLDKGVGSLAGLALALLVVSVLLNLAERLDLLWAMPEGYSPGERRALELLLWIAPASFQVFRHWLLSLGAGASRPPV